MAEGLKTTSHQSVHIRYLTPSPYGHSPYLICDEQGERIKSAAPNLIPSGALWVSPFSPIASQHRRDTEETIVSEKRD